MSSRKSVTVAAMWLREIINRRNEEGDVDWIEVRTFLRSGTCQYVVESERSQLVENYPETTAPLNVVCNWNPPLDVIIYIIDADPLSVKFKSGDRRLPLHIACGSGASLEVVEYLTSKYPDALTKADNKGNTPLHSLFQSGIKGEMDNAVKVLSFLVDNFSSSSYSNNVGHTPLHLASAAGLSDEGMKILFNCYPKSCEMKDRSGRVPLHLAMTNSSISEAHTDVVKVLMELGQNSNQCNIRDGKGKIPIRQLADSKKKISSAQKLRILETFEIYMKSDPDFSADFLVACLNFPEFIRTEIMMRHDIREMLNRKAARSFPMFIIFLDFVFIFLLIICQRTTAFHCIQNGGKSTQFNGPMIVYAAAIVYFGLRELLQLYTMTFYFGAHILYFSDVTNWLDIATIALCVSSLVLMRKGADIETFRVITAYTTLIIWFAIINYLRIWSSHFALFVDGVKYIVKRLMVFLIAIIVILYQFAQCFHTINQGTPYCKDAQEENANAINFCTINSSFIMVYGMLVGSINIEDFEFNLASVFFFLLFGFVVVIVLLNVLIVIVSVSWDNQIHATAIFFWTDRLKFLVETNALLIPFEKCANDRYVADSKEEIRRDLWDELNYKLVDFSIPFFGRIFVAFAIAMWILLGIISLTLLWPPQIREFILVRGVVHKNDIDLEKRVTKFTDGVSDETGNIVARVNEMKRQVNNASLMADKRERQLLELKKEISELKTDVECLIELLFRSDPN